MESNILSRKEFYLLVIWIVAVITIGLIERYKLVEDKRMSNKLEIENFEKREIEVTGKVIKREP